MRERLVFLLFAAPLVCGSDRLNDGATPVSSQALGIKLPANYRDWHLITVAHEEGTLNDLRAILDNSIASKTFRRDLLPFPDGAIIARLAWQYEASPENNAVFGHPQSFVAGKATNVQLMVKDSKKYASTDGWGFAQFLDGKPVEMSPVAACFPCHRQIRPRDMVFSHYSR